MKTSHILFFAAVTAFLAYTLGINWILKRDFDHVDKKDPYIGYSSHPLKPFKYVKLYGEGFALTEIRTDKAPQLKMIIEPKYLDWKVSNDTLAIYYKPEWKLNNGLHSSSYEGRPSIYVFTPELAGVTSENVKSRLMKVKTPRLDVHQKGSGMFVMRSEIGDFRADVQNNGYLRLHATNAPLNAQVTVADTSLFESDKDIFKRFDASLDSMAHLNVPGSVLKKLR